MPCKKPPGTGLLSRRSVKVSDRIAWSFQWDYDHSMNKEGLIKCIDDLVSEDMQMALWKATRSRNWYFGAFSNDRSAIPFWNMERDGVAAADVVWEHAKPQCEELVGASLEVLRQYANGHTFGQGGKPHTDDSSPGTYTLIYYPMSQWHKDWDGGTVFQAEDGEIISTIQLKPNRAVLFDAQILHYGRAPSRMFTGLRVTVAYKLKTV